MNRGIVIEIGKRHAIVLTPDGQFRKVPARRNTAVGEEINFSQRELARPRGLYSIGIAAAAVMLLLFIPFLMKQYGTQKPVAAYLTMDINPSVELGVDDTDRVVELRALNKDGAAVISSVKFKGLPVDQVAGQIIEHVEAGPYLKSGEGDIVITSVLIKADSAPGYESQLTARVDAAVRKVLAKSDKRAGGSIVVTTLSAPKEVRDEANVKGLSAGKMTVYLLAKSQGRDVSIEQLKTESIHQTVQAWGGLDAIVSDSKINGTDKEKQDERQKEQLKQLLKEDKKAAAISPAKDDEKDNGKKDNDPNTDDKKNNGSTDKAKNNSGKASGGQGEKKGDGQIKKPDLLGNTDPKSKDDGQKPGRNKAEDAVPGQNQSDDKEAKGNGNSKNPRAGLNTPPQKMPDPGPGDAAKERDKQQGNPSNKEPSSGQNSGSIPDKESPGKQKGSSEQNNNNALSGQGIVKNDSNGRDIQLSPDNSSSGADENKDQKKGQTAAQKGKESE
ncbi:anti-sigma factor domain-containing protein [Paenibacillus sp. sptzw28]|uniref:anti-sigma factor domain-containing protein n=1 Tax=Paenibacillus sp. sptzw28 TaxID=715179 RepID=UPI001C6F5BE5|nr:anti-sigma factor domain-containing protein [Paenibacillus sp. sptzw28]QYR22853.1 anti-sigma factor domain-containing protein [Paenibacillus sp. sptzw28]